MFIRRAFLLLSAVTVAASFSLPSIQVRHQRSRQPVYLGATSSDHTVDSRVRIEYCTGCRWMLKSLWLAQELLTTFEDDLGYVTVVPSSEKGIFKISLNGDDLIWDRKERGGFPSTKELKQSIRDKIEPSKYLGHSDTEERKQQSGGDAVAHDADDAPMRGNDELHLSLDKSESPEPSVAIYYCTGCRWLLRAAYFGQELLTTFGEEIKSVTLIPSPPPFKGGQFTITLNGETLFDRGTEGRFPEVKEIKQAIRDSIAPEKDLGHSDIAEVQELIQKEMQNEEEIDEDEATEQRKFFGVS